MNLTKKAFTAALKQVDPNTVLQPITGCSAESRQGATIGAVERAASRYLGISMTAGMQHLCIGNGSHRKAPKWFAAMMLKTSWQARELNTIRVGDLLANC